MKLLLPVPHTFKIRLLELGKYREAVELALLSLLSYFLPVLIGEPQLLLGSVINALIIRQALTQRGWKAAPTIFLPSLGAVFRGLLFGTLTRYLILAVPFIWLGNFSISYFSKLLATKSKFIAIILPALIKSLAIFLPVFVLVQFSVLPKPFLAAMGIIQFATAAFGGIVARFTTSLELKRQFRF